MGLLDQLWDDTVAGPPPDTGLSRLRWPPALRVDPADLDLDFGLCKDPVGVCSRGPVPPGQDPQPAAGPARVTRSIRIRRPPPQIPAEEVSTTATGGGTGSPPLSPATPSSSSPFAGEVRARGIVVVVGGYRERFRFRRSALSPVPRGRSKSVDDDVDGATAEVPPSPSPS